MAWTAGAIINQSARGLVPPGSPARAHERASCSRFSWSGETEERITRPPNVASPANTLSEEYGGPVRTSGKGSVSEEIAAMDLSGQEPSSTRRRRLLWKVALIVGAGVSALAIHWPEERSRNAHDDERLWFSTGQRDAHAAAQR